MYHKPQNRNPVSRIVSYSFVMLVIIAVLGSLLVRHAISTYNEREAGISAAIGTEIVLNGDTLMVLDYDWWENHYILNDGTQISTKLLDDLEYLPKANNNGKEGEETQGD